MAGLSLMDEDLHAFEMETLSHCASLTTLLLMRREMSLDIALCSKCIIINVIINVIWSFEMSKIADVMQKNHCQQIFLVYIYYSIVLILMLFLSTSGTRISLGKNKVPSHLIFSRICHVVLVIQRQPSPPSFPGPVQQTAMLHIQWMQDVV